jgi:ATP-dependent DNA helicase RecQ
MHVLHAVKEMEERKALRGIGVAADILRGIEGKPRPDGSTNNKFRCFSMLQGDRLDTIEGAIRWMLTAGILRQEDVGNGFPRPVLKLTERGRELVNLHPTPPPKSMRTTISGSEDRNSEREKNPALAKEARMGRLSDADFEDCFKRLRVWRSGVARQKGIAAFCIFHDSVLKELASRKPATMDELRGIPGLGPKKLADYGSAVLAAIADR